MAWDGFTKDLDQTVDRHLGNTVAYALDGLNFENMQAFVINAAEADDVEGFAEIDPLNKRHRLKIGKYLVSEPKKEHRLRHPLIEDGVDCRPGNWQEVENGRYWLIEPQKV